MRTFLSIFAAVIVAAVWMCLKYWQAKAAYSKDLGDGGVQKLFDKNSK